MNTTKTRAALVMAAAVGSLALLATPASAATPTSSSLPVCHAGTDGGRRGIMDCYGGPGHVRLVTHCSFAPDADSGWIYDSANPYHFHYENTCLFGAQSADALVEP